MRLRLPNLLAAATLFAAPVLAAQAQTGAVAIPGTGVPALPPNASGTITYQSSGGTTRSGEVTVFHGTGSTTTVTFGSSGPPRETAGPSAGR
jgi:hypothetical protein